MNKRKRDSARTIPEDPVVQDYVDFYHADLYYEVKNDHNVTLFTIPKRVIQRMSRDVVGRVVTRCEENKGVGSLLPSLVKVRDHRAFLPKVGSTSDSKDYIGRLKEFFYGVFGTEGVNCERDDFYDKLNSPNLTIKRLKSLYFHEFLLNEEERVDFPADSVDNLRNISVYYFGKFRKWHLSYTLWEVENHNEVYDLLQTSRKNYWALQVYLYRERPKYPDSCVGEAELARNLVKHINERREKAKNPPPFLLDKRRIGHVLYTVLPKINRKMFNFMFECNVDMDFKKSLSDLPET